MQREELRELQRNAPRAPFRIHTTAGEMFDVYHRNYIAVSDSYSAVVVPEQDKERLRVLNLVDIGRVDVLPKPTQTDNGTR